MAELSLERRSNRSVFDVDKDVPLTQKEMVRPSSAFVSIEGKVLPTWISEEEPLNA